jgi:hypothetical protein
LNTARRWTITLRSCGVAVAVQLQPGQLQPGASVGCGAVAFGAGRQTPFSQTTAGLDTPQSSASDLSGISKIARNIKTAAKKIFIKHLGKRSRKQPLEN